jgi:membrane fusion protein, multidrug efflux system
MKLKQIIIGLLILVCGGAGVFAWMHWHRAAASEDAAGGGDATVVSVQTGTLKRMTLHHYIEGYGLVNPAPATASGPAANAPLAAAVAGVVAKINAVEGQQVKKGDVVVELNSGAMTLDYAEQELARQKKLWAQQHNTSLRNLQNAQAQLDSLQVVAPLSGTVVSLNVKPGMAVDVNTVVADVMDLDRLVVNTDIPVSQAGELETGQTMQVLTEPPVKAPITYISPTVNTNDNTVRARAALSANSGLRPGQFVSLRIVTAVHTNCLAVPEESVVTDQAGRSVISLVQGDEAIRTPVQTGFKESGWVEVQGKGLKAGDTVVTVGAYGLPEKTQIRVEGP